MPKELWGDDDKGLSFTASLIGEPISMDENTKLRRRIDYVRVCVFVSAEQELSTTIHVFVGREFIFKVEYEWIPAVCSKFENN